MPIIKKKELPEPTRALNRPSLEQGTRNEELAGKPSLQATLSKLYSAVENGFQDQGQRADDNSDWWDVFNTVLSDRQFYSGNSQIFVPIVRDAVLARKTRFVNQIFPQNGRFIQVITEDGKYPDATISLLESYIRKNHLRDTVMPALVKNGDIEGQYTIYVDWCTRTRDIVYRTESPLEFDADELEDPEAEGLMDPEDTVSELKEEHLKDGFPFVEVISDNDFLVLPATASSIDEAMEVGGSITVMRRWSEETIRQKIADDEIDEDAGNSLIEALQTEDKNSRRDTGRQAIDAAGIKKDARGTYAQVYETWTKLTIKGKKRIYKVYFGGSKRFLSCRRNPYWCDKLPVFSCAVDKVAGSFKGRSLVEPVATFQYAANDAANEGMDSAAYAMLPIIMTDPEKNPKVGSLILSLAAIWETSPKDTQFAQFPQLWKDAFEIVSVARAQIFQSLSVNPASITQGMAPSKKPNQAEVANEQQIDLLTTADAVTVLESGILTPMAQFMLELDHQFRDKETTVFLHGRLGIKAQMEKVPITSLNVKHYIQWFGVEAARNAQAIQQQIAAANVLRGIPPQLYPGYQLDLTPIIVNLVESAFGPTLAPLIFKDQREMLTIDPMIENELLIRGEDLPVHALDNLQLHMQAHIEALQATGDPHGTIMAHLLRHRLMASVMPAQAEGVPGTPGGAGPGIQGQAGPRIGAQPGQATGGQNPPGMIAPDNMSDPSLAPRM